MTGALCGDVIARLEGALTNDEPEQIAAAWVELSALIEMLEAAQTR